VEDMVRSQFLVVNHLGIEKLHAAVGSSLGGMQSLMTAALFPDRIGRIISISACVISHPSSIAVRYVQRRILMSDANWNNGNYYEGPFPHRGMRHARELAMIGYRSGPEWKERFGTQRANPSELHSFCPDYQIETYLEKKAEVFSNMYDPNSVLYISKAMDMFDMGLGYESLLAGVARVKCPVLVLRAICCLLCL
jgi:homoserine O-acetyltransferase